MINNIQLLENFIQEVLDQLFELKDVSEQSIYNLYNTYTASKSDNPLSIITIELIIKLVKIVLMYGANALTSQDSKNFARLLSQSLTGQVVMQELDDYININIEPFESSSGTSFVIRPFHVTLSTEKFADNFNELINNIDYFDKNSNTIYTINSPSPPIQDTLKHGSKIIKEMFERYKKEVGEE